MTGRRELDTTPLDGVPIVVVVDRQDTRRHRLAEAVAHAGGRAVEAATPLDAIALIEDADEHVAAVVVGRGMTQTRPDELAGFVRDEHPEMAVTEVDAEPATAGIRMLLGTRAPGIPET